MTSEPLEKVNLEQNTAIVVNMFSHFIVGDVVEAEVVEGENDGAALPALSGHLEDGGVGGHTDHLLALHLPAV